MVSRRERFDWSFTGYNTGEEAERAVAEMVSWFNRTYKMDEWSVISSVSNTPNGFRASLNCEKTTGQAVEDATLVEGA